jgi:riboflavin kinase/FMN adenylyltransferase
MLGRPFSVFGTVVRGRNIGRQLGFPTANLDPHNEVRPPSGVYAARVTVRGRAHGGAAFVAETADAQSTPSGFVIEAYILDFEGSLYGEDIEIGFLRRLREVRRFASMPALREQIGRDVEAIREQLGLRAPERLAAEAEEWDESLDSRR